ncbi:uncharacterized protein B0I36DRAFT_337409 [Microdochium trichocladiopsis]|uniref:Uncharacterized protein n=1 Tax=Microdochium trichocladiopsis TaxID=1682393 RepID=A0A9P9BJ24_9PEZI|nr:uncharacterized protein B0I36DRAFT_337409 [Microdochium trichocladiopsis]KAH7016346.1 hypothetical protein B0I36DRAFT_337409 [Microdochium trichocladiopsis]
MADRAGLALGAISPGVDVFKGLITYLDALRSHTDELQALSRRTQTLLITLKLLGRTVRS